MICLFVSRRFRSYAKWSVTFVWTRLVRSFLIDLVLAAMTIANVVRTSLGPLGLDKMLVDDIGVSFVYADRRDSNLTLIRMSLSPTMVPPFSSYSKWNIQLRKSSSNWLESSLSFHFENISSTGRMSRSMFSIVYELLSIDQTSEDSLRKWTIIEERFPLFLHSS